MRSGDLHNCTQFDVILKGDAKLRTLVRSAQVVGWQHKAHFESCHTALRHVPACVLINNVAYQACCCTVCQPVCQRLSPVGSCIPLSQWMLSVAQGKVKDYVLHIPRLYQAHSFAFLVITGETRIENHSEHLQLSSGQCCNL